MAIEPSGERIFDPFLGQERDAFPGELPPQGEETSFQRALREAGRPYIDLYNQVAQTGQLSTSELAVIIKAREIAIKQKADELEEAFKANPAAIIQRVILANSARVNFNSPVDLLDQTTEELVAADDRFKKTDKSQGRQPKNTLEYFGQEDIPLTVFRLGNQPDDATVNNLFGILRDLGGLPVQGISSFQELLNIIPSYSNTGVPRPDAVTLYRTSANRIDQVIGLKSTRPELSGISFGLDINDDFSTYSGTPNTLIIKGTPEICAKIIDTSAGFKAVRPAVDRRIRGRF